MSDAAPAPAAPDATAAPEAAPQETFSRDYVEALRAESANYRTKAKTAGDEAKAAVIKEYEGKAVEKDTAFAELQTQHTEASTELLKLKAVIAAQIPVEDIEDVVALVKGSDEESVTESVNRVKALLGKAPASVPAVDRTQGSGGGAVPLNGDPILNMLKQAVGAS